MINFSKLDRPPAAENWVRMQHRGVDKTALKMFNFLRGGPIWNYNSSKVAVKSRIEHRIDLSTAQKIVTRSGSKLGRPYNLDVVNAFFDYEKENPIDGVQAFDDMYERFPLSRQVSIPIKPLTVVREGKSFVPYFLCPWSSVNLTDYQARLLFTIVEKSIFTLTDFEDSDGKFLFFPKVKNQFGHEERKPMVWSRGQFPLLSDKELAEQIKIYFGAKPIAKNLYIEFLKRKEEQSS